MITDYEKQANNFLKKVNATIEITFKKFDFHFNVDKEKRDIYEVTIKRGKRKFTFDFGNSLNDSGFYFTVGRKMYELDRKYLDSRNLTMLCKQIDCGFSPSCESDVIHKPVKPSSRSILACLTKYDPDTFENFCSEYGYDADSKTAEKIYNAVINEWQNVCALFTDEEIQELAEIQ